MILGFLGWLDHRCVGRHVGAFDGKAVGELHARAHERQELVPIQATPARFGEQEQSIGHGESGLCASPRLSSRADEA